MRKVYLENSRQLAWLGKTSSSQLWNEVWRRHGTGFKLSRRWWQRLVSRFPVFLRRCPSGIILEAGCGDGAQLGVILAYGLKTVGLDYDQTTLTGLKQSRPDLNLVCADVRALPFKNDSLAGYTSFGVIEHFEDGYDSILGEMSRVLQPGGFSYISFPAMSIMRRAKAWLGMYESVRLLPSGEAFYQYALIPKEVRKKVIDNGFRYESGGFCDALSGLRREWKFFLRLQRLMPGAVQKFLYLFLGTFLSAPFGHVCELLHRKRF